MKELKRILKYSIEFYFTLVIPLLYLFILFIIKQTTHTMYFSFPFLFIGIPLTLIGIILWILSYIHLGKSFGVLPQHQKRVQRGVYKYLSHPMYIGISMAFVGLSLSFESYPGFLFTSIILIPLLMVRTRLEDRKLKN